MYSTLFMAYISVLGKVFWVESRIEPSNHTIGLLIEIGGQALGSIPCRGKYYSIISDG